MNDAALLQPKLSRLRLSGILENLDARLEQAVRDKWSFSQFLHMLFDDEIARREQRQLGLRLTKSGLDPVKTLETFDFSFNARIHEPAIRQLATGDFLNRKDCVFLLGPSGVGKSHLAQGLGHSACRKGYDVMFRRTYSLLKWIRAGFGDGSYEKRLQTVIKIPLLILDDFGLKPLSEDSQSDLYEIICERYEKVPTIITSNRDMGEWITIFTNPLMGAAAMDRLVDRAIRIVIEGKSYRMENFVRK
ncbi:MAG: IS21-like element helper ATPase IstB, partial [Leptospiraceae bacterium]|nr:IS21-like element helper ATPase IstB [Leptospiraceae bacterium]